ncbi:MAG: L,D-transpeptidase family protein [Eubacterium sp.]|nr:L,D-transpeptidase family protein [Eubacterium sp.]
MSKQRKRRKKRRNRALPLFLALIIIAVVAALYIAVAVYFKNHFFPNTTINGYPVSKLTAQEADDELHAAVKDYLLTVFDRNGEKYHLEGSAFNYSCKLISSASQCLERQNAFLWPTQLKSDKAFDIDTQASYDEEKLTEQIKSLALFSEENAVAPENACLVPSENGYEIQPESAGNMPDTEHMINTISAAVADGQKNVTLTDEDYLSPEITAEDPSLTASLSQMEKYLATTITYEVGQDDEILNCDIIKDWIALDEQNNITVDEQKVTNYVQSLASKYNTYADKRQFHTSSGDVITIGGGDYGWVVDKDEEKAAILEEIKTGETISRRLHYQQEAKQEGTDDIGNTYIEIDYTKQHIWYYKDGTLQLESDIVSGNISRNNGSPDGVFKIVFKKSPATLVGEDYSSDVTFFLPYAYNVGIHDASWRSPSEFGGDTYKTSGSHGCINVPYEFVEQLYGMVEVGTPVIAYYREPVTLTAENAKISNAYSYVDTDQNTP